VQQPCTGNTWFLSTSATEVPDRQWSQPGRWASNPECAAESVRRCRNVCSRVPWTAISAGRRAAH
jgi:hypothetical protein